MPIPNTVQELAVAFRELGTEDPESWAKSELSEGIPQLARCSVLRSLWRCVRDDDETSLQQEIDRVLRRVDYETTTSHLMARCLEEKVSLPLLNQLVRSVQIDLLQQVTYGLDGDSLAPSVPDVGWGIFQTDEDGKPFGPQVWSLFESFISLDPTGREGGAREV